MCQSKLSLLAALSDKVVAIEPVPRMYVCMDGTGVATCLSRGRQVVQSETEGRSGKGEEGKAKTREAKLGCVFTQTRVDPEGRPMRDEKSTSYTGAIEPAEAFGYRLSAVAQAGVYREAKRRGMESAREVCVIRNGALWIWNSADEHFYGAVQIVDLYHAREHYWNVAKTCFGQNKQKLHPWTEERRTELDNGRVEDVIRAIKRLRPPSGYDKEVCAREVGYFEKNKERMRYAEFRRRGLFVGSGVLEAG